MGRRKLVFISGIGMTICTLTAGLYMYYEQLLDELHLKESKSLSIVNAEKEDNDYVLLICVLGYVAFSAIGIMVIPWILIGEILPTQVLEITYF